MILTSKELMQIYEGLIKPFGHPDPLGFATRIILQSDGDPDFIGVDGRRGIMPVDPQLALEMTGATEVQSLEANLVATLTMDRMFFDQLSGIDRMIAAFHFGAENVGDVPTGKAKQFIDEVNESREEVKKLMYPPLATVKDVISVLNPKSVDERLTKDEKDFFELLVRGK